VVCCVSREHACVVSRINVGSCYMQCVWVCSVCFVVACICAPTCLFFLCDAFSFRLPVLFTTCAKLVWLKLWAYTVFATTTISRFFLFRRWEGWSRWLCEHCTHIGTATHRTCTSHKPADEKWEDSVQENRRGGASCSVTCC
jgi:hypothetical protein